MGAILDDGEEPAMPATGLDQGQPLRAETHGWTASQNTRDGADRDGRR